MSVFFFFFEEISSTVSSSIENTLSSDVSSGTSWAILITLSVDGFSSTCLNILPFFFGGELRPAFLVTKELNLNPPYTKI